jgi:hypothetical protein
MTKLRKNLLLKAIKAGERIAAADKAARTKKDKADRARQEKEDRSLERRILKQIGDGTPLFIMIRDAVARGEKHIDIGSQNINEFFPDCYFPVNRMLCRILNEFSGITAKFTEGEDYINTDEMKEYWSNIEITWVK